MVTNRRVLPDKLLGCPIIITDNPFEAAVVKSPVVLGWGGNKLPAYRAIATSRWTAAELAAIQPGGSFTAGPSTDAVETWSVIEVFPLPEGVSPTGTVALFSAIGSHGRVLMFELRQALPKRMK